MRLIYTVIETPEFDVQARKVWTDAEHDEFIDWLAINPLKGAVIPGADGARKVRWSLQGKGKRGGTRVIYFNMLDNGVIVLIAVYAKSVRDSLPAKAIKGAKHDAEKH